MEFSQIALLLVSASILGIVSLILKQPLIVGYLFAGIFLSKFNLVSDSPSFESLGQIGITLLLFLIGLEMNLKEITSVGKPSLYTGIGQIVITFLLGFFICHVLGFESLPSAYISIALTFSSTIIIVKLLSEKKDLQSLYGRISIGFLLIQDLFAMAILMYLSSLGKNNSGFLGYLFIFVKATAFFYLTWVLSKNVLPKFIDKIVGKSTELTFIFSIAWAMGVATFSANILGFTFEIGGFLAGIALSGTNEHLQIAARARPLRDFFLTIFFLQLGVRMGVSEDFLLVLPYAFILSVFVLLINPIIVMSIMGIMGYKKRTSFLTSLSTAQISEFSLIIVSMGAYLGHLTGTHVSLVTLVGVITMTLSTYIILGSGKIYRKISPYLQFFEKKVTREGIYTSNVNYKNHIVLVGCDRTGKIILRYLKKFFDGKFVVVDFNPSVFNKLFIDKTPIIFGDIEDPEIIENVNFKDAKVVVSTISDLSANLTILEYLKKMRFSPKSIFTATNRDDGIKLYEKGATFVIVPEMIAGDYIKQLLKIVNSDSQKFEKLGTIHFSRLILNNSI